MLNVVLPLIGLATLSATPVSTTPAPRFYSAKMQTNIFDLWKTSVVVLELDDFGCSAFLVDRDGTLVTSASKTLGTTAQPALRLPDNKRFAVQVIQNDLTTGVAVIKVHTDAVKHLTPIPIPNDGTVSLGIGDTVKGIENNPIKGLKGVVGIVSMLENGLACLDIKRDGFIGGSPLFGDKGQLVGMASDVMKLKDPASSPLPVISIRHISAALIAAKAQSVVTLSANPLPSISSTSIPRASLQKVYDSSTDVEKPNINIPGLNVAVFTPFAIQRMERKMDTNLLKKYKGKTLDEIRTDNPDLQTPTDIIKSSVGTDDLPIVIFEMTVPLFDKPVRMDRLGRKVTIDNAFEYRNGFLDIKVMHGKDELLPVRFHRFEHPKYSRKGAAKGDEYNTMSAVVMYDPRGFDPAEKITVKILTASKPNEWISFELDDKLQNQIWDDFADWRALNPK